MPLDNAAALGPGQQDPTAGIPQSDTEKVARGLVGDSMVERFGDVIGVRKPTMTDALRDATYGSAPGPDGNALGIRGADAAHAQIQAQYQKTARQAEAAGIARAEEARKKNSTFAEGMKTSRQVPKARRKDYIKELAKQAGLEIDNSAVINALADSDLDFAAVFEDPEVQKMMTEDPTGFNQKLQEAGASGNDLINLKLGFDQASQKKAAAEDAHTLNASKIALATAQAAKLTTEAAAGPKALQPTAATRTMQETAKKVLPLVQRVRDNLAAVEKEAGPGGSRYQEVMTGKVGAPNPKWTAYRTNAGLLTTLMMRMHVGARGGEQMMAHFKNLADSGIQSPENMRSALDQFEQYANDVAETPTEKTTLPGGPKVTLPPSGAVPPGIKAIAKTLADKVNSGEITREAAKAQLQALQSGGAGS